MVSFLLRKKNHTGDTESLNRCKQQHQHHFFWSKFFFEGLQKKFGWEVHFWFFWHTKKIIEGGPKKIGGEGGPFSSTTKKLVGTTFFWDGEVVIELPCPFVVVWLCVWFCAIRCSFFQAFHWPSGHIIYILVLL